MDFPIENGGSFYSYVKLPEGNWFKDIWGCFSVIPTVLGFSCSYEHVTIVAWNAHPQMHMLSQKVTTVSIAGSCTWFPSSKSYSKTDMIWIQAHVWMLEPQHESYFMRSAMGKRYKSSRQKMDNIQYTHQENSELLMGCPYQGPTPWPLATLATLATLLAKDRSKSFRAQDLPARFKHPFLGSQLDVSLSGWETGWKPLLQHMKILIQQEKGVAAPVDLPTFSRTFELRWLMFLPPSMEIIDFGQSPERKWTSPQFAVSVMNKANANAHQARLQIPWRARTRCSSGCSSIPGSRFATEIHWVGVRKFKENQGSSQLQGFHAATKFPWHPWYLPMPKIS